MKESPKPAGRCNIGKNKGQLMSVKKIQARLKIIDATKKRFSKDSSWEDSLHSDWEGRRLVEVKTLADELWCTTCNKPLSMRDIVGEEQMGLASLYRVKCTICSDILEVHTNRHYKNERRWYSVNCKASIALLDAGIGEAQFNTILSALNVPRVTATLLKRHERIIGPAVEAVARESCQESVREEIALTKARHIPEITGATLNEEENEENLPPPLSSNENLPGCSNANGGSPIQLKVSYDAGWQRRGTGHAYNSLSGHSSLIGYHSGKILSYASRSKRCSMCERGHKPEDHDCRKNYEGSAKAMETDMAVELINRNPILKEQNAVVSVLIGDDDCSTISAVRRESETKIEKWSDLNHAKKGLTSALYALRLPLKIIKYFASCFSTALKQNRGNAKEVEKALLNIVPHSYGEHEECGEWCRHRSSEKSVPHQGLPNGEPLTDIDVRASLTQLFARYASNASKLAPCASSQGNEAFNNIVASKHPKNRHYAASESLHWRVATAVCQKNIGTQFILKVNEKASLSPGGETGKFRLLKDRILERKRKMSKAIEIKRRRLFNKQQRSSKTAAAANREGITYQSNCGFSSFTEMLEETVTSTDLSDCTTVIFDVETTGLSKSAEICQIAACCGENDFDAYIVPSTPMSPGASAVTGLRVIGGEMFLNDERLDTVPPKMAFTNFVKYLRSQGNNVILVAHNGFRYDAPIILRHMKKFGLLNDFCSIVKGFSDSLPILKEKLVERKKEKKKFSQESLAHDFLGPEVVDGAHNAVCDVTVLNQLLAHIGIDAETIKCHTKSVTDVLNSEILAARCAQAKASLGSLKDVSASMRLKIAKAGIDLKILKEAYKQGAGEGVRLLLGEDVRGKPRVTKSAKIIKSIVTTLTASQ